MRKLTHKDLLVGLKHLRYEHLMLKDTAQLLSRPGRANGTFSHAEQVQRNMLVESFAVHARVLYCFLWDEAKCPDDIVAADYVPGWSSTPAWPRDDERGVFKMTSRRIVHLSLRRKDYEASDDLRGWDVREICGTLHTALVKFYESPRVLALVQEVEAQMRVGRPVAVVPPTYTDSTCHTSSYGLEPFRATMSNSVSANATITLREQLTDPFAR